MGLTTMIAGASVVSTACSLFNLLERRENPIPPNSSNDANESSNKTNNTSFDPSPRDSDPKPTKWTYNGLEYDLSDEDRVPTNIRLDAGVVLENNAAVLKQYLNWIPNKELKIYNFNEYDVPTIAKASVYIRSLNPFSQKGIARSEFDDTELSLEETKAFYRRLKEVLLEAKQNLFFKTEENQTFEDAPRLLNNSDVTNSIVSIYRRHLLDNFNVASRTYGEYWKKDEPLPHWGKLIRNRDLKAYVKTPDAYTSKVSIHEEGWNTELINNVWYRTPVISWKVNRAFTGITLPDFDARNRFDNEMFLSREFYERTLNDKEERLQVDWFDWMYANKSSTLMMTTIQFDMLYKYVDFIEKLYNSYIDDPRQGLIEQLSRRDSTKAAQDLEEAMMRYAKLEYLVGITTKPESKPNLQIFPGHNSTYTYVDFIDTYKWMVQMLHDYIQPFTTTTTRTTALTQRLFDNTYNTNHLHKYQMVHDYLRQIYKIHKPRVLNLGESSSKWVEMINVLETKLAWIYDKTRN